MTRRLSTVVALLAVVTACGLIGATSSLAYNDGGFECSPIPYVWCKDTGSSPHGYHNWTYGESQNKGPGSEYLYVGISNKAGNYEASINTTYRASEGSKIHSNWSTCCFPYIGKITLGPDVGRNAWGWFYSA